MSSELRTIASLCILILATSCRSATATPAPLTSSPIPPSPTIRRLTPTAEPTEKPSPRPQPPTATVTSFEGPPSECFHAPSAGTPAVPDFDTCSDFTLSSDGKYLAFFFGQEQGCTRGIMVADAQDGRPQFSETHGALAFEFLANDKMLLTRGHCEGAYMSLLDPATSQLDVLGEGWITFWNPAHTAFVVTASPYHGLEGAIWGYNVPQDLVFLSQPEVMQKDDHPLWTPDGTHVIFQRRALVNEDGSYSFPSGRQIVRVRAATGEQSVLLSDPRYDFHLCANALSFCDRWYADWVQVRRFPFQPQTVDCSLDLCYYKQFSCLFYGIDCPNEPELFALNWRTGKLIPWDENLFPAPTPKPKVTYGPGEG